MLAYHIVLVWCTVAVVFMVRGNISCSRCQFEFEIMVIRITEFYLNINCLVQKQYKWYIVSVGNGCQPR